MTKLYYTATSCGAANFIAAHILGLPIESEVVVLATHKTASGADFYTVNAKGNVPTIDDFATNFSAAIQWPYVESWQVTGGTFRAAFLLGGNAATTGTTE